MLCDRFTTECGAQLAFVPLPGHARMLWLGQEKDGSHKSQPGSPVKMTSAMSVFGDRLWHKSTLAFSSIKLATLQVWMTLRQLHVYVYRFLHHFVNSSWRIALFQLVITHVCLRHLQSVWHWGNCTRNSNSLCLCGFHHVLASSTHRPNLCAPLQESRDALEHGCAQPGLQCSQCF